MIDGSSRRILFAVTRLISGFIAAAMFCWPVWATSVTYQYDTAGRLTSATYDNGTVVTYSLDAAGNRSSVVSALPAPPGSPSGVSASSITTTTATISWSASTGTVSSYQYSLNSGSWVNVGTSLSASLVGLAPGTTYSVQVQAINGGGSATAMTSFATLSGTPGTPTLSAITTVSATASWTAAPGLVQGYQYRLNSGAWTNVGTVLTVNLTSLTPGTAYTLQIQAIGTGSNGAASSASFDTTAGTPGTPSASSITASSMTIGWAAAPGNVVSYQYRVNSGSWISVGTALTASLSALSGATAYTVQIEAVGAGGAGAASSNSFTTLPGAEGAPTVSSVTTTTATVSWAAVSGSVSGYRYSINSGSWVVLGNVLSVNLTGLAAGTAYTVQVEAIDGTGDGAPGSVSFSTLPGTPGTPTASSITVSTATITWTAAAGTITGYQYSINSSAWTSSGTGLSFSLTGLSPNTSYTFQVRAVGAGGYGAASSVSFTTLPVIPQVPGTPTITNIAATTATATWTASSGATSYQYSLNSGSTWTSTGASTTVNLTGLTPVTTYTIEVRAVNAGGASIVASASFTTLHVTYTDTPTLKVGNYVYYTGYGVAVSGYNPAFGSLSPSTTTTGRTYIWLANTINIATGTTAGNFEVSGFSSDPGIGWLQTLTVNGASRAGSSGLYSYSAGTATWQWLNTAFSFPSIGSTTSVVVVHQ